MMYGWVVWVNNKASYDRVGWVGRNITPPLKWKIT